MKRGAFFWLCVLLFFVSEGIGGVTTGGQCRKFSPFLADGWTSAGAKGAIAHVFRKRNRLFCAIAMPFIYKNDLFIKTGSGQTAIHM